MPPACWEKPDARKGKPPRISTKLWIGLLLGLLIWGVYWQVAGHKFLIYDDRTYVSENQMVLNGLTWEGIRWAFTSTFDANWFPLTWLSHMLDVEIFGNKPVGHHLVNVGFHSVNTILLLLVLAGMTENFWCSAAVAAVFAMHPLRIESVAWAAERKDVLSAFFWFMTMLAYWRFTKQRSLSRYLAMLACFICGLLSKPMLVTLPFLLLLLDYWPLRRLAIAQVSDDVSNAPLLSMKQAVSEKIPMLILAVASSAVTFYAQQKGGTVSNFDPHTVWENFAMAMVSYVVYLRKLLWPSDLAVFYPFDFEIPLWQSILAMIALISLSGLVLRQLKKRPYLAVGWFWYLGTMVPVIGFVKVGAHAYADRYTYIPLIGVTIMIVWGVAEASEKWRYRSRILISATLLAVTTLSTITYFQLRHWQDTFTIFRHALAVTKDNWLAHNNLAAELIKWGKSAEGLEHVLTAISIKPDYTSAYVNLGIIQARLRNNESAIQAYKKAIELDPESKIALYNLGIAQANNNDLPGAYDQYRRLLVLDRKQSEALLAVIRYFESKQHKP